MEKRRKKERWLKRSRMEEATRARKAERQAGATGMAGMKRAPVVRHGNVYEFPPRGEPGYAELDIDEALDWPV